MAGGRDRSEGFIRPKRSAPALRRCRTPAPRRRTCSRPHARPTEAITPPARLEAVGKRLDTMLQAVKTVRAALDDFYGKLTDEQKAQFEAIGPAPHRRFPVSRPLPTSSPLPNAWSPPPPCRHSRNDPPFHVMAHGAVERHDPGDVRAARRSPDLASTKSATKPGQAPGVIPRTHE